MSRSLNRQVLLLGSPAVSHCKAWLPVIYNAARFSFHSWCLLRFFVLMFGHASGCSRGAREKFAVRSKAETALCLSSSRVFILGLGIWHLGEWGPLWQENTFRKICLNHRSWIHGSWSNQNLWPVCFVMSTIHHKTGGLGNCLVTACAGVGAGKRGKLSKAALANRPVSSVYLFLNT